MSNEILKRDQNSAVVLGGITDDANLEIRMLRVDPVTNRLLVSDPSNQAGIIEVPTGTIDGSNTIFTFTVAPKVIVVDQGRTMINGYGYTLVGLVATLDIAPVFSIFSI